MVIVALIQSEEYSYTLFIYVHYYLVYLCFKRACLVRALMPQAVLWDIKFGRRTTKILIDEFFDIPLLLAKKKFFFDPPCWCCLTGGRGESAFWGVSDVG